MVRDSGAESGRHWRNTASMVPLIVRVQHSLGENVKLLSASDRLASPSATIPIRP